MKRFSIRDFALLCLPLLLIAGVGWMLTQRKPPAPPRPLHLDFRVEKPTTIEAFKGADATLVVQLKGRDADAVQVEFSGEDPFLELQTDTGMQTSRISRGYSGVWIQVWHGVYTNFDEVRLPVSVAAIPPGKLGFGFNTKLSYRAPVPITSAVLPALRGKWPIDRSKIRPFDFKSMPRVPLIELREVKIVTDPASIPGSVSGECVFDLKGVTMDARTPIEYDFPGSGAYSSSGWRSGIGYSTKPPPASGAKPTRRICQWTFFKSGPANSKTIVRIKGRISAAERWPLAFEVEPFDYATAKVGQKLKFKTWPATMPKAVIPDSAGS